FDSRNAVAVTNGLGTQDIWRLGQKGTKWFNIFGDFPSKLRTYSIFADRRFGVPALYVGTTRGVFHSVSGGANLTPFAFGLPNTGVADLQYAAQLDILAAASGGRSAWEILLTPAHLSGVVFFDHNGNGVKDVGDQGLSGRTVYLDVNNDKLLDVGEY